MNLSYPVLAAVLLAAALHASWNVAIRAGSDRRRETLLLSIASALLTAAILPLLPWPRGPAWPHLGLSAVLHGIYFALVAEAYSRGGVSLAYPLMRGTAPLLTTVAATLLLGEHTSPAGWVGVAGIASGVVLLARRRGETGERAAVALALANAVVIAGYTLNDAVGARESGSPVAYALWTFLLSAPPSAAWLIGRRVPRPPRLPEAARALGGAACSIGAYGLALWAMTHAPVAPVAALRETAMLFGIVLARTVLGERPGARGWVAAGAIAAGAAVLRLA